MSPLRSINHRYPPTATSFPPPRFLQKVKINKSAERWFSDVEVTEGGGVLLFHGCVQIQPLLKSHLTCPSLCDWSQTKLIRTRTRSWRSVELSKQIWAVMSEVYCVWGTFAFILDIQAGLWRQLWTGIMTEKRTICKMEKKLNILSSMLVKLENSFKALVRIWVFPTL